MELINEIRFNPITGETSIISNVRRLRPKEIVSKDIKCPFCPGNEILTPPATLVVKKSVDGISISRESVESRSSEWDVRIFPNKYPALSLSPPRTTFIRSKEAYGYHEVVVETPKHVMDPFEISSYEYALALWAAFRRVREILENERIEFVTIIKNRGLRAGASISHTHMQIFALPITPPRIEKEITVYRDGCPICNFLSVQIFRRYLVYESDKYVVFTNPAPRSNYEVIVAPKKHEGTPFSLSLERELLELASILRGVLYCIVKGLEFDAYNFWFHIAPKNAVDFHWHIEIAPVSNIWGGFEKSTDIYIVEVPPEEAAEQYKKLLESTKLTQLSA